MSLYWKDWHPSLSTLWEPDGKTFLHHTHAHAHTHTHKQTHTNICHSLVTCCLAVTLTTALRQQRQCRWVSQWSLLAVHQRSSGVPDHTAGQGVWLDRGIGRIGCIHRNRVSQTTWEMKSADYVTRKPCKTQYKYKISSYAVYDSWHFEKRAVSLAHNCMWTYVCTVSLSLTQPLLCFVECQMTGVGLL